MDQDQLNTHYKRLASTYNQSFTSSTEDDKKGYTFLGEEGAKIAFRRTEGPVDGCIAFHCDTPSTKSAEVWKYIAARRTKQLQRLLTSMAIFVCT